MEKVTNDIKEKWKKEQLELKKKLIKEDYFDFSFENNNTLKYIGGVDISFVPNDTVNACAAFVILSFPDLKVVYEDYQMVMLTEPYIPCFLAFREVFHLMELIEKVKKCNPEIVPQVIFVDGNGYFHPSGFGLACHLGVLTNLPTIGISKNFLYFDSMNGKAFKKEFQQKCLKKGDWLPLKGKSGTIWGSAFKSSEKAKNPIYVSIGHRISLETCNKLTALCSEYRIPSPVRSADLGSRNFIKNNWNPIQEI